MLLIVMVFAALLAGCGPMGEAIQNPGKPTTQTASVSKPSIDEVQLEPYDGPKARIAVYRFGDKSAKGGGGYSMRTGWYSAEIGDGMADMMNDALVQSNRFIVLDRQSLEDVLIEQDLGASGRIKPHTAARIGEIEGAELLIKGAVTEFEPGASGAEGSGALGLFGLPGALVGGALAGVQQSHIAMVVQVVDAKSSRILFSSTVEGKANDFNLGGMLDGFGRNFSARGGLGVWQKTPMEKAIRVAIINAVQEVSNKTPKTYYRHTGSEVNVSTPPPATAPAVAVSAPKPEAQVMNISTAAAAAVIKVKSANLRDAPGTHGKLVGTLKEGTKLAINAEENNWLFVETEDGKLTGWIGKSLVK